MAVSTGRSRKGAWIEIPTLEKLWPYGYSRSRKGAWIEIDDGLPWNTVGRGRSRKGAWIEMIVKDWKPRRKFCRSRKGAWIEINRIIRELSDPDVAPVRERGLKFIPLVIFRRAVLSLP